MECINIALAKGRLVNKTLDIFSAIGINFEEYSPKSRKLIFYSTDKSMKLVLVKSGDVPIYVEKGAADIGVAGKDALLEAGADVYELLDLGIGRCRFAVASMYGFEIDTAKKLRVATKYPNLAKSYYNKRKQPIDIIKLNGSVELAPVTGLSDVIVDIVETGSTLKENGLVVREDICSISARMIANKVSFRTKGAAIGALIAKIRMVQEGAYNEDNKGWNAGI